jgi:hypothetical protein
MTDALSERECRKGRELFHIVLRNGNLLIELRQALIEIANRHPEDIPWLLCAICRELEGTLDKIEGEKKK